MKGKVTCQINMWRGREEGVQNLPSVTAEKCVMCDKYMNFDLKKATFILIFYLDIHKSNTNISRARVGVRQSLTALCNTRIHKPYNIFR